MASSDISRPFALRTLVLIWKVLAELQLLTFNPRRVDHFVDKVDIDVVDKFDLDEEMQMLEST